MSSPSCNADRPIAESDLSVLFRPTDTHGDVGECGSDVETPARIQQAWRASERRFRAIIEYGTDLIAIIAADGTITYASPSHERVLGYPPSTLVGVNAFDLLHPDDLDRIVAMFMGGLGEPHGRSEFRFRHADGSWRSLEGHASNLLGDAAIGGVVVCSRDVTERNEAAAARDEEVCVTAALARAGRELMALLETPLILDRLCALTADVLRCDSGTTWLWNAEERAYAPIAGYGGSPAAWSTLRHARLHPSSALFKILERDEIAWVEADANPDAELRDLMRSRAVSAALLMAIRRGDQVMGIHVAAYRAPTRLTAGEERIAHGLAHLASMALTNAQLVEELEAANRVKSQFVSTMSHELRTPLNIILGYLEMLADGVPAPDRAVAIAQIRHSTLELLGHIEASLDVSRLEHRDDDERLRPVEVSQVWKELESEFADTSRSAGVALRWMPVGGIRLTTDRRQLRTILKNVIGNALKFTSAGEVMVSVEEHDECCTFVVRDTGIGIAPDHLPAIFEMFHQVDGSDSRSFGGVGLGLYVVRVLVDRLGGHIDVDSAVGRGTTFRIAIPKQPPRRDAMPRSGSENASIAAVA